MRFAYLLLCDAASSGSDGKLNLLGIGVRAIRPEGLPAIGSIAVAGAVEGDVAESGPRHFELALVEPDGARTILADTDDAALPTENDVPGVPVQFVFVVNMVRPFAQAGPHTLRASYGDLTSEYIFIIAPTNPAPKPKRTGRQSARPPSARRG